ncbi:unnamed protein product [Mycena citricolor]|uniref:Uncharacterized protein n=1 Tax=Mycena citricolor TaxID=2018698 RepID=A0AAD2HI17_9AGAR|nr:unnamed protein product [Mycena citricolor]
MTSARISLSLVVDLNPPVWYLAFKNASSRALARLELSVARRINRVTSVLAQLFPSIPRAMTRPFLLLTAFLPAAQRVSTTESQEDIITHGADHSQMCPLSEKQPAPVCANTLRLFSAPSSSDVVPRPQLNAPSITNVLMAASISLLLLAILFLALKCTRQRPRLLRSLSSQKTTEMQCSNSIEEVARLVEIPVSENLSVVHATQEWYLFESENLQSRGGTHCTDRLVLDAQSLIMPAQAAFLDDESPRFRRMSAAFDVERRLPLMLKVGSPSSPKSRFTLRV